MRKKKRYVLLRITDPHTQYFGIANSEGHPEHPPGRELSLEHHEISQDSHNQLSTNPPKTVIMSYESAYTKDINALTKKLESLLPPTINSNSTIQSN